MTCADKSWHVHVHACACAICVLYVCRRICMLECVSIYLCACSCAVFSSLNMINHLMICESSIHCASATSLLLICADLFHHSTIVYMMSIIILYMISSNISSMISAIFSMTSTPSLSLHSFFCLFVFSIFCMFMYQVQHVCVCVCANAMCCFQCVLLQRQQKSWFNMCSQSQNHNRLSTHFSSSSCNHLCLPPADAISFSEKLWWHSSNWPGGAWAELNYCWR